MILSIGQRWGFFLPADLLEENNNNYEKTTMSACGRVATRGGGSVVGAFMTTFIFFVRANSDFQCDGGEGFIPPCRRFPAGRCFRLRNWACRRVRGRRFPVRCRTGDAGAACRRVRVPDRGRGTVHVVGERPG